MENIEKTIIDNKLNKNHLNKLNDLIYHTSKNIRETIQNDHSKEKKFFKLLYKLKNNGKILYQKYGYNLENKEKILILIIENLSFLLNNLEIKRVHNSSKSLLPNYGNFKELEQLKNFFRIRGKSFLKDNIIGHSCNNFNIWIYNFINDITNNDSEIKWSFYLNKLDNHGFIGIKINQNKFYIDSNSKGIEIKKMVINKKIFYIIKNIENYKKFFQKGQLEKNSLTYNYANFQVKFIKKGNIIIFFYSFKPIKNTKIYGFKRIYKIGQKTFNSKKIFYLKNKFKNIKELLNFLENKFNENDFKIIKKAILYLENEKLKQFL